MNSDQRPSLLFVSHVLPFPPDRGVSLRTLNVLKLLASEFDITAVCFFRWSGGRLARNLEESVDYIEQFARTKVFPIPQEHSRIRWIADHFRSVLTQRHYLHYGFWSEEYASALRESLEERDFDLVHVDTLYLSRYLPMIPDEIPVACVHHNVESELMRRRSQRVDNPITKKYLRMQAELLECSERRWCKEVDLNVTVSAKDKDLLNVLVPSARCVVIPNGVDVEFYRPDFAQEKEGIAFLGGTEWFPNLDALEYYAEEILPLITKEDGSTRTVWIGRAKPEEREKYGGPQLELTGFVDDVRPYLWKAACFVAPLRVGGGTRLKILEAWAMGMAVVSTSVGCEGLTSVDGENILVRDDPRSFAEAVRAVLEDPNLRESLGRAGRRTVEEQYSWKAIGRSMVEKYRGLM